MTVAGEALEVTSVDATDTIPAKKRPRGFSPFLRIGAALRKGASDTHPVKLARLGVSGQGSEGEVTPLPPLPDPAQKQLDLAVIRPGVSFVRISYHNTRNEYLYEVIEPPVSPLEKELTSRLHEVLIDEFEPLPELDPATKRTELRLMVDRKLQEWELAPARSRRDGSSTTSNGTSSATGSSTCR